MKLSHLGLLFVCFGSLALIASSTRSMADEPAENRLTGELTADVTLSGTYVVSGAVTVPAGRILTILPGTTVLMTSGASIVVSGQLVAEGTQDQPILFTRSAAGTTWKQIKFVEAADSTFAWCTFQYATCGGAHQDYYDPTVPRNYHEAIVALACHLDLENCVFQKLVDSGGQPVGDAMAIIADDLYHPGPTSATVRACKFLYIGQGVHTRYAYVIVEDCYFQGKAGDNDDVDLYGESTPPCIVRRNLFDMPCEDDRVHPTLCSAIITDNVIKGSTDHGIVLRDRSTPIVMNNVISGCPNGGIAVENSCTAVLINNTIFNCSKGVHLFDLGRWDHPYHLHPGGGTATITNCIIWNCPQGLTLEDTSNTTIKDRGSHVTVSYCDIQGGRNGISVSGSHSTVTWGQGNINTDPLFANATARDFHLKSEFGRWDAASKSWVNDAVTSPCIDAGDPNIPAVFEPYPNGGVTNMGAYGNTAQASKSQFAPTAATIRYELIPDPNAIVQTGGIAGVHQSYQLEGQFELRIDFQARTASFWRVDYGPPTRQPDLGAIFNMDALVGTLGDDQTITFTGKAADGGDIVLTLTFQGDLIHLVGETIPPAGSADFFLFNLDAWAKRK